MTVELWSSVDIGEKSKTIEKGGNDKAYKKQVREVAGGTNKRKIKHSNDGTNNKTIKCKRFWFT